MSQVTMDSSDNYCPDEIVMPTPRLLESPAVLLQVIKHSVSTKLVVQPVRLFKYI